MDEKIVKRIIIHVLLIRLKTKRFKTEEYSKYYVHKEYRLFSNQLYAVIKLYESFLMDSSYYRHLLSFLASHEVNDFIVNAVNYQLILWEGWDG